MTTQMQAPVNSGEKELLSSLNDSLIFDKVACDDMEIIDIIKISHTLEVYPTWKLYENVDSSACSIKNRKKSKFF